MVRNNVSPSSPQLNTASTMLNITIDPVWPPWFSTRHLLLTGRSQVYDFAFDRLRSVRQDMIIQRTAGPESRAVLERTVRLLAYASFRLCGEPLRLYDPRINDTHLQESLSWLLRCYDSEPGPHGNREEFQALSLLYNLGGCGLVLDRFD